MFTSVRCYPIHEIRNKNRPSQCLPPSIEQIGEKNKAKKIQKQQDPCCPVWISLLMPPLT